MEITTLMLLFILIWGIIGIAFFLKQRTELQYNQRATIKAVHFIQEKEYLFHMEDTRMTKRIIVRKIILF